MLNVNLVVGWGRGIKKMGDSATFSSQEAHIQLLDAALGHPVKDWQFSGREVISIGRMPESDVEISELRVSRLHAQLHWREGKWILVSCGRHGVIVNNRQITELTLESEITFQLGPGGPVLRFCDGVEVAECTRTLGFENDYLPVVALDETKLHEDVGQITDGEYFQKLQAQAKFLRARRNL